MNYLDNVFADFKDGDNQQQLELYLHHRDLRADFDQIENEELNLEKEELTGSQKVELNLVNTVQQQSPFAKMKRWCFSILS
jgi:hypothetical protein